MHRYLIIESQKNARKCWKVKTGLFSDIVEVVKKAHKSEIKSIGKQLIQEKLT